jgi:hypothetical protein
MSKQNCTAPLDTFLASEQNPHDNHTIITGRYSRPIEENWHLFDSHRYEL